MINLIDALSERDIIKTVKVADSLKKFDWDVYIDSKPVSEGINFDYNIIKLEINNPKNVNNVISMLVDNGYFMHYSKSFSYYARTNVRGEVIMPTIAISSAKLTVKTNKECDLPDLEALIKMITNIHRDRKIKV